MYIILRETSLSVQPANVRGFSVTVSSAIREVSLMCAYNTKLQSHITTLYITTLYITYNHILKHYILQSHITITYYNTIYYNHILQSHITILYITITYYNTIYYNHILQSHARQTSFTQINNFVKQKFFIDLHSHF